MITVCPGWTKRHEAPIVLKDDGKADDNVSHGMCPDCDLELNGAIDLQEQKAIAFAAYRANPTFDPRD